MFFHMFKKRFTKEKNIWSDPALHSIGWTIFWIQSSFSCVYPKCWAQPWTRGSALWVFKRGSSELIIHEQIPIFRNRKSFHCVGQTAHYVHHCIVCNNNNNNSLIVWMCHFTGSKYHETTDLTTSLYVQFVEKSVLCFQVTLTHMRNIVWSGCVVLKLEHSSLFFLILTRHNCETPRKGENLISNSLPCLQLKRLKL